MMDLIDAADKAALARLARGKRFAVDVGAFAGAATLTMAEAMAPDGRLLSVDTFEGTPGKSTETFTQNATLSAFFNRTKDHKGRIDTLVGRSEVGRLLAPGIADLVFIDAAHDYWSVKSDIEIWRPVVRPGGILAGHDFEARCARHDPETIFQRSEEEFSADLNCHFGVYRAVTEAFGEVDSEARVWWVAL